MSEKFGDFHTGAFIFKDISIDIMSSLSLKMIVANIVALAYLIGSLMVDVDFDVIGNTVLTRQYYCALSRSLTTIVGITRLAVPIGLAGFSQMYLCLSLQREVLRQLQIYTAAVLLFIGTPSLIVSMFSVRESCEPFFVPDMTEAFAIVRAVHCVMFVILSGAVLSESYILVRYVKEIKESRE